MSKAIALNEAANFFEYYREILDDEKKLSSKLDSIAACIKFIEDAPLDWINTHIPLIEQLEKRISASLELSKEQAERIAKLAILKFPLTSPLNQKIEICFPVVNSIYCNKFLLISAGDYFKAQLLSTMAKDQDKIHMPENIYFPIIEIFIRELKETDSVSDEEIKETIDRYISTNIEKMDDIQRTHTLDILIDLCERSYEWNNARITSKLQAKFKEWLYELQEFDFTLALTHAFRMKDQELIKGFLQNASEHFSDKVEFILETPASIKIFLGKVNKDDIISFQEIIKIFEQEKIAYSTSLALNPRISLEKWKEGKITVISNEEWKKLSVQILNFAIDLYKNNEWDNVYRIAIFHKEFVNLLKGITGYDFNLALELAFSLKDEKIIEQVINHGPHNFKMNRVPFLVPTLGKIKISLGEKKNEEGILRFQEILKIIKGATPSFFIELDIDYNTAKYSQISWGDVFKEVQAEGLVKKITFHAQFLKKEEVSSFLNSFPFVEVLFFENLPDKSFIDESIINSIRNLKHLTSLLNIDFTNANLIPLAQMIGSCINLENLSLINYQDQDQDASVIIENVTHCHNLKKLDLGSHVFDIKMLSLLMEKCKNLTELSIRYDLISKDLEDIVTSFPHLTHLTVCTKDKDFQWMSKAKTLKHLELTIKGYRSETKVVDRFPPHLISLFLNLNGNPTINNLPAIEHLKLNYCGEKPTEFPEFPNQLKKLELKGLMPLTNFPEFFPKQLESLDVIDCKINSLKLINCNIYSLRIKNCYFGEHPMILDRCFNLTNLIDIGSSSARTGKMFLIITNCPNLKLSSWQKECVLPPVNKT